MKEITVTFPGGKRVDAHCGGYTVHTDQSPSNGGQGTAPEPFALFFASIAACSGIYALEFCTARHLNAEDLSVKLVPQWDNAQKRFSKISLAIRLPKGFPRKYEKALERAVSLCSVKKHIVDPPQFDIRVAENEEFRSAAEAA